MTQTDKQAWLDDVLDRGDDAYRRLVTPTMETAHRGELIGIDVETENHEFGNDVIDVCDRLRRRNPNARIALIRVGGGAVDRIGFSTVGTRR